MFKTAANMRRIQGKATSRHLQCLHQQHPSTNVHARLHQPAQRRQYAIQSPSQPSAAVFNTAQKHLQRTRAATSNPSLSRATDYVRTEVATRLVSRLLDISRHYDRVLDWGAGPCTIARTLATPNLDPIEASPDSDSPPPAQPPLSERIGHLTAADSSEGLLFRDAALPLPSPLDMARHVLDSPEAVPYAANSFDLVLSAGSLHWTNDLPGVLAGLHNCLKPDCALLAAMPGGDSLYELRGSLQLAEQERRGGVASRVSPLADVRDVGNLLGRAGFKLLTVDVDDIVVGYPDVVTLMRDLGYMGEGNASLRMEQGPIGRETLMAAEAIYREMYGDEDGGIPATFRTIYMIGWKEGEGQAKPLQRGTGEIDLKGFLEGGKK